MDDTEHRRRRLRWWLCTCGNRFPCGPYLARQDDLRQTQDGETRRPDNLVGWNIHRAGK